MTDNQISQQVLDYYQRFLDGEGVDIPRTMISLYISDFARMVAETGMDDEDQPNFTKESDARDVRFEFLTYVRRRVRDAENET